MKSGKSGLKIPGHKQILSPQEVVVLKILLAGNTVKEIAKITGLSHRTIETYLERIKLKFGCQSKGELICYIFSYGINELINDCHINFGEKY